MIFNNIFFLIEFYIILDNIFNNNVFFEKILLRPFSKKKYTN